MTFRRGYEEEHHCSCHKLMGNDFWFLPRGSCLFEDGRGCDEPVCIGTMIEAAHSPAVVDPLRGGELT